MHFFIIIIKTCVLRLYCQTIQYKTTVLSLNDNINLNGTTKNINNLNTNKQYIPRYTTFSSVHNLPISSCLLTFHPFIPGKAMFILRTCYPSIIYLFFLFLLPEPYLLSCQNFFACFSCVIVTTASKPLQLLYAL